MDSNKEQIPYIFSHIVALKEQQVRVNHTLEQHAEQLNNHQARLKAIDNHTDYLNDRVNTKMGFWDTIIVGVVLNLFWRRC
jgi:hypothetical protein